jgi:hypothetical protein
MAKVLCRLQNATSPINGYRFVTHRDGMISEELDAAVAKKFASIPGYEIYDPAAHGTDPAAQAILEAARNAPPVITRVGPTEPDNDMVICPACTSQFKATPVNVQARLRELEATPPAPPASPPAKGTRPAGAQKSATPPAAPPPPPPSTSSSTPPADEKPTSEPQF